MADPLRLSVELSSAQLEQIALRVAELVSPNGGQPKWLDVEQAAAHLGYGDAKKGRERIYDLKARGLIEHAHDGRRLLLRRNSLDEYLTLGKE